MRAMGGARALRQPHDWSDLGAALRHGCACRKNPSLGAPTNVPPLLADALVVAPLRLDDLASEVVFGVEGVVGGATQREIRDVVLWPHGEWHSMVKLEEMRLRAARAAVVDVSAAWTIAFDDGAAQGRREVAARRGLI